MDEVGGVSISGNPTLEQESMSEEDIAWLEMQQKIDVLGFQVFALLVRMGFFEQVLSDYDMQSKIESGLQRASHTLLEDVKVQFAGEFSSLLGRVAHLEETNAVQASEIEALRQQVAQLQQKQEEDHRVSLCRIQELEKSDALGKLSEEMMRLSDQITEICTEHGRDRHENNRVRDRSVDLLMRMRVLQRQGRGNKSSDP